MDIEKVKKDFVKNLNEQLHKSGMKRKDLAEKIGVPYSTVCSYCNGSNYPRIDKVEKIAKAFGIPKSKLIEDYVQVPDGYFFLDKDEQIMIQAYERSSKEQQARLLAYFKMFLSLEGINVNAKEKK